jgi:hypothetical protein
MLLFLTHAGLTPFRLTYITHFLGKMVKEVAPVAIKIRNYKELCL